MTKASLLKNIRTFGVLSIGGGLPKVLHDGHFGYVRLRDTFYVVNINLDTMVYLASMSGVESFLFCVPGQRDNMTFHKYEPADKTQPYHKKYNPYRNTDNKSTADADYIKTIPWDSLREADRRIAANLLLMGVAETLIESTMNQIGQYPWYVRQKLYYGLY
ncbi:MAG: hypothetical protein K2H98_06360 [Duncaniella sp.]|nr:hypothetical protein [Duncaniella sp.]